MNTSIFFVLGKDEDAEDADSRGGYMHFLAVMENFSGHMCL